MYRQSEKIVKQQYVLHMSGQYGERYGPITAAIDPVVWGTPANFNGFCVLVASLHGTPVLGVTVQRPGVEQRAPPIFGRAAMRLGIGSHSSSFFPRLFSTVAHCMYVVRTYFYTCYGLSANLRCTRLAKNTGRKKIAFLAPSHNFVGLYLCS